MYPLGTDVAKRRHHATLLDEDGTPVFRNFAVPHSRQGFEQLLAKVADTAAADAIRVGMEATGHYWMVLFEAMTQAGYAVGSPQSAGHRRPTQYHHSGHQDRHRPPPADPTAPGKQPRVLRPSAGATAQRSRQELVGPEASS